IAADTAGLAAVADDDRAELAGDVDREDEQILRRSPAERLVELLVARIAREGSAVELLAAEVIENAQAREREVHFRQGLPVDLESRGVPVADLLLLHGQQERPLHQSRQMGEHDAREIVAVVRVAEALGERDEIAVRTFGLGGALRVKLLLDLLPAPAVAVLLA